MNKADNDFGLKEINLKDYKLKKNNFPVFSILFLVLLIVLFNFKDIFIIKDIPLDSIENESVTAEIKEEIVDIDAKPYSNDSIENIYVEENKDDYNSITEINHITGNYYIISGSFSNYKLSLNKANNLLDKGFSAIIIFPVSYNNKYRVAIKTFNNVEDAKEKLPSYKKQINDELWILKH